MTSMLSRWRAPVTGAAAGLAVAGAVVGPSALAAGGRARAAPCAAKAGQAADAASTKQAAKAAAPSGGPGPGPFLAAVAQLVRSGTITSAQGHVLDADIRAGSIDPHQLVASGTLTSAQMAAVGERLSAVKRSLAPANPGSPASGQAKAPSG